MPTTSPRCARRSRPSEAPSPKVTPTTIVEAERHFFQLVFRGSHSLVAELLANTFDQIFDAAIDPEGRVRLHWDDVMVSSGRLDAYRRVIEAIERRDTVEARRLVEVIVGTIPAAVATASTAPVAPARRRRRRPMLAEPMALTGDLSDAMVDAGHAPGDAVGGARGSPRGRGRHHPGLGDHDLA